MLFLKEFCVFSQTLQQQNRDNFFQVRISCFSDHLNQSLMIKELIATRLYLLRLHYGLFENHQKTLDFLFVPLIANCDLQLSIYRYLKFHDHMCHCKPLGIMKSQKDYFTLNYVTKEMTRDEH